MKGHFIGGFVQDKWRPSDRLTVSVGARYDLELTRTPNQLNPLSPAGSRDYPDRRQQHRARASASPTRWTTSRARPSAAASALFYQRTSFTFLTPMFSGGRFSDSFVVQYPAQQRRPGPACRQPPDGARARQRADGEPRPHRRPFPARHPQPQRRHRAVRQPRSTELVVPPVQPWLRAAARARRTGRRHRLHPLRAARPVRARRT